MYLLFHVPEAMHYCRGVATAVLSISAQRHAVCGCVAFEINPGPGHSSRVFSCRLLQRRSKLTNTPYQTYGAIRSRYVSYQVLSISTPPCPDVPRIGNIGQCQIAIIINNSRHITHPWVTPGLIWRNIQCSLANVNNLLATAVKRDFYMVGEFTID